MKTTSAASMTFPARSFFRMFAAMLCAVFCLRVSPEEELKGLDITEHGNDAYAGFQIFTNE